MPEILRTTAMRLALRYAVANVLLVGLAVGALDWSIGRFVDAQLAAGIRHELETLSSLAGRNPAALGTALRDRRAATPERHYLWLGGNGRRLGGDLLGWPAGLAADGAVHNVWIEDDQVEESLGEDAGYWPMAALRLGDGSRLLVAREIRPAEDLREFSLAAAGIIVALTGVLTLALGWFLGRTVLGRIDAVTDTAREIAAGRMDRRIPVSARGDEFDRLAGQLNLMLERIERLVQGLRQVSDNVAHDLRRPLSRLRNRLEVTLLEAPDEAHCRRAMERALDDTGRLIRTFNALLEIAQAEAGVRRGEWGRVNLDELAEELGSLYQGAATDQGLHLSLAIEPGLAVTGERHLLAQALGNLLENALQYTPPGGSIAIRLERCDGWVCLRVADTGPGIPADQRGRVLERFVRLDPARSSEGSGLGLSLVRAVADLHGAKLQLEDNRPGLRVSLVFPGTV